MIRNSKSDIHYELSVLRSLRDKVESPMRCAHCCNAHPRQGWGCGRASPTLPGARVPPAPARWEAESQRQLPRCCPLAPRQRLLFGSWVKARMPAARPGTVWPALNHSDNSPNRRPGRWRGKEQCVCWLKAHSCLWSLPLLSSHIPQMFY